MSGSRPSRSKSRLPSSTRAAVPNATAIGMATRARTTADAGNQGADGHPQRADDRPEEEPDEHDERSRPVERDGADDVAVLGQLPVRRGREQGRQAHDDTAADPGEQDADDEAGQAAARDLAQDRVGRGLAIVRDRRWCRQVVERRGHAVTMARARDGNVTGRRPDASDRGRLRVGDRRRQVGEERIGPGPGRAVVLADGAVAGGLDPQRQPEDLDEPDRRRVVERVALVVRRQALVVQRQRGAPTDDDGLAVVEADPDVAGRRPAATTRRRRAGRATGR